MKGKQNKISNMTKYDDVKKKIENLYEISKEDNEKNCPKLRKGVKSLRTFIHTYPIHKFIKPKTVDFQEVLGYKDGTEILGKKIGFISRENYEQNKEIIEQLRKEANIEELKQYLNEKKEVG